MKKSKIESYLGLARRAGKIVSGYQTCIHTISKKDIKLLIVAADTSENTKQKFSFLCEKYNVPFREFGDTAGLSQMTGLRERGIHGIADKNFAEVIIKEIDNEKITLD